jgi:RNA polymerase sigma-70 factor (ECF subfamily)
LEEKELIEKAAAGSESAFGYIVNLHKDMVYSLAVSLLSDGQAAKDVSQDVFARVYRSLGRFGRESSLRTWIYRIAYNRCMDEIRRRKRFFGFAERFRGQSPPPETKQEHGFKKKIVAEAMKQLNEQDRALIVFYYLEELELEEISGIVGTSRNALKTRLHRARAKLRKILETEYGFTKEHIYE